MKNLAKSVWLLSGVVALSACQQPEGYSITGTLTGDVEGKTVYLCTGDDIFQLNPLDSTVIENGTFRFTGKLEGPELLTVRIFPDSTRSMMGERGVKMRPIVPLFMENDQVEIKACLDSIPLDFYTYSGEYDYTDVSITGSALNDAYQTYRQKKTDLMEARDEVGKAYYAYLRNTKERKVSEGIEAVTRMDSATAVLTDYLFGFAKENAAVPVGLRALKENADRFTAQQIEEVEALVPAELKSTPLGKEVILQADSVKMSAVGASYIDYTLQTPEGKEFKLSDYIGKGDYVLIEFWASWCGPCRGEIPHLKEIYKLYHSKGFEIVSISMDEKKEDWLKALEKEKMDWIQGSDLKAFGGDLQKLYNFSGIPHCVLVNPEGKIIHRNSRGSWLDKEMLHAYGNQFGNKY